MASFTDLKGAAVKKQSARKCSHVLEAVYLKCPKMWIAKE
jgi:hypothetical protein